MGKRSRRTGNREEHNLAAQLPGAKKISRNGYTGPDVEWRGRHIEAKYRTDGFTTLYRWLREVQILDFPGLRTRARTRARTRVGSSSLPGPALVLVREKRDGYRASERIGAMVQLVNHTDVVSVQDLEALISEARHLTSEEDAGTVHADLGGNLARTTGSGGEAT